MLESCQNAQERWGGVHLLIDRWLKERHELVRAYDALGAEPDTLAQNPKPDRDQIVAHMSTNICRCGTYPRIVRAIQRAAQEG